MKNKKHQVGRLEKFGVGYLQQLRKKLLDSNRQLPNDETLVKGSNRILLYGIVQSALIGAVLVGICIYTDQLLANQSMVKHYLTYGLVTVIVTIIEFYLLFIIALRVVHHLADLSNLHFVKHEFVQDGPFSILNILSRTALEIPDPEFKVLEIDAMAKISKRNLLIVALFYKARIVVSNLLLKFLLIKFVGTHLLGIYVGYEAVLVECFWNAVLIWYVVKEARLRVFGFILADKIGNSLLKEGLLASISEEGKKCCIRAIANAVVLTKNYHPNMIILLLRFKELLKIESPEKFDDWSLFIESLQNLSTGERFMMLDLLTVAGAFDGKISDLENTYFKEAYQEYSQEYFSRLERLKQFLTEGRINAAYDLCKIDKLAG